MLPGFEIRKEEGATGTTASMNLKYTESASLSTHGFTKPGWKLIGWSTEENASVPVYQPKQHGWNINKSCGNGNKPEGRRKSRKEILKKTTKILAVAAVCGCMVTPSTLMRGIQ